MLLFLAQGVALLPAQTAALFNVNTTQFPRSVGASFFLLDTAGNSLADFTPSTLRLLEDGTPRRILSVSCPPPTPSQSLSVVLTLDVSGSMAFARPPAGVSNMEIAKQAARALLNAIRLGTTATLSEAAVTSFDHENYFNQDWTTDKAKLGAAVNALQPGGGTDYDAGFILKPAGAIDVAKTGKHKRIIIFLTDGAGNGSEEVIVDAARRNDITIYCVTLGLAAPQILRNAAQRTGGICIENVTSAGEAVGAFLAILQAAQNKSPCQITWESVAGCSTPARSVELTFPAALPGTGTTEALRASASYTPPANAQIRLAALPEVTRFFDVPLNTTQERTITVAALNADFTVRDIIRDGDSTFTLEPRSFSLRAGESRTLTLRYTARTAGFALAAFTLLTDTCASPIVFATSYSDVPPVSSTLRLLAPNGGEEFLAGSDGVITWTGVSPLDTVRLELSIDNGTTWHTITEQATGLQYLWRNIPNMPSKQCLMRATQIVAPRTPDRIAQIPTDVGLARIDASGTRIVSSRGSQTLFWVLPNLNFLSGMQRHQSLITSVDVRLDSAELATADETNNLVTWDASTGSITGGLVGNIGRIVGYSPDSRFLAVAGTESANDRIFLYNAATNQLLRTITIPGASVPARRIIFSSDNQTLGLVRSNGTMLFWRIRGAAAEIITALPTPWPAGSHIIRDAAFQQNGALLALAIQDTVLQRSASQVRSELWHWNTGRLVRTLHEAGTATRINSINFSRSGERLITAYNNGVSLWNIGVLNQDPPRIVTFPAPVIFAEFHPDEKRFLVVTGDKGLFYTFAEPLALQHDVSDSLWAIVAPSLRADSLNMGGVAVGAIKDSIIVAFLRNTGTYPVRIDSLFFTGDNANDFAFVSGLPIVIPPGSTHFVEIRFLPRAIGERTATLHIAAQHATLEYGIRGVGIASVLQISPTLIDFGTVLVGTQRDSTVQAVVRNTGAQPITIHGITLGGPDNRQFALLSEGGAFTLAAGEARALVLRFAPTELGRTSGSLLFDVGTGTPVQVRLFGHGVDKLPPPSCTLKLVDTAARPGDNICISLIQSCSAPPEVSTSITVLVSMNATLLLPQGTTPQGVVGGGIRYIPITLNLLPVATAASQGVLDTRPLQNLCFSVMLGNTTATQLHVEVIDPPGAFINATSGQFRLITSQAGGNHLYFSTPRLRITSISPNPANEQLTVRFDNVFVEMLTLTIVDVYGRTVLTQSVQAQTTTGNEATIVVRDIPPGIYILRLRSPRETAAERIVIVR